MHPRDAILQAMQRIYRTRMTTTSGGNISVREECGAVWITPARLDKGALTRDDIVEVAGAQSRRVDGPRPSSELPFHEAIYAARPDIRAVVHAHPVALVAFSMCCEVPETRLFPQAHAVCGRVGLAEYALPGSATLGDRIATRFAEGCDSVVLENHGVVVGGESLDAAFQRFEAFEFVARTQLEARSLGAVQALDDEQLERAASRSVTLPAFDPPPASADERELRRQLAAFVQRGCRQRLLISTEGSFSARLGDDSFLITPTQRDRERLQPESLVLVDRGRRERGRKASRAVLAHRAIYREHPDVEAIAFAHPVHATAFSVTAFAEDGPRLDVRTIPESYVFLRDVASIPFGAHYSYEETTSDQDSASGPLADFAKRLSPRSPAALLENDGVVVTGRSVLDAFDRLEVLETTAEAIITARGVGTVRPMPDAVIEELREAFDLP